MFKKEILEPTSAVKLNSTALSPEEESRGEGESPRIRTTLLNSLPRWGEQPSTGGRKFLTSYGAIESPPFTKGDLGGF